MAIASTTHWEVRSGGNDLNGGGFDITATGTDYSQSTTPHLIIDGVTVTAVVGSTQARVTFSGYTVSNNDIGNVCRIQFNGTGSFVTFQITGTIPANNEWQLDRNTGQTVGTGVTGRMGGCRKSVGSLINDFSNGNFIWVKNDGSYSLTTSTSGDGGPWTSTGNIYVIEGYKDTRGDKLDSPTIDVGVQTSVKPFESSSLGKGIFINLKVNGNNNSTITAFELGSRACAYLCNAINSTEGYGGQGIAVLCKAEDCSLGFECDCFGCFAKDCDVGFSLNNQFAAFSIARSCSTDGFFMSVGSHAIHCVAYVCNDGFDCSSANASPYCFGCISVNNTGFGYNTGANIGDATFVKLISCAGYGNTSGRFNTVPPIMDLLSVTLTGDPFMDGANDDFRLNDIDGAGALCRSKGINPVDQIGNIDLGAVQYKVSTTAGFRRAAFTGGIQ